jgi:hypothetical protein
MMVLSSHRPARQIGARQPARAVSLDESIDRRGAVVHVHPYSNASHVSFEFAFLPEHLPVHSSLVRLQTAWLHRMQEEFVQIGNIGAGSPGRDGHGTLQRAGSSLAGGGVSVFVTEMVGVFAFIAFALFGRWGSPAILAVGYLAHGVWDAIHHLGAISTWLPEWYAPFCLGYDGIEAVFVWALFLRR